MSNKAFHKADYRVGSCSRVTSAELVNISDPHCILKELNGIFKAQCLKKKKKRSSDSDMIDMITESQWKSVQTIIGRQIMSSVDFWTPGIM